MIRRKERWQGRPLGPLVARAAIRPNRTPPREPAPRRYAQRALVVDVLMLALVAALIAQVSPTVRIPPEPLLWAALFPVVVVGLFYLRGMYAPPLRLDRFEALRLVITGSALATMIVMSARTVLADGPWVAAETVRHWLIALPFLAAGRWALMWFETRARRHGASVRPTLIVGSGRVARLTAKRLLDEPELGLVPVGYVDDDPPPVNGSLPKLPLFDGRSGFEAAIADSAVSHVIVAFSTASHEWLLALVRRCWELGVTVSVVPRLFEVHGEDVALEHLGNLPLMDLRPADHDGVLFKLKYALDRVVAAAALVILAPVMALTAALVFVSVGRPVLYRQRRVGRDGTVFDMLKFRTMRGSPEQDGEGDADWAAEQLGLAEAALAAPQRPVPALGTALRRFSIDELPQLWNVLRGEMSLIGPRPTLRYQVERYTPRQARRLEVKPGITGWAQIHGRAKLPWDERIELDVWYVEHRSARTDLLILLRTPRALFGGTYKGATGGWKDPA